MKPKTKRNEQLRKRLNALSIEYRKMREEANKKSEEAERIRAEAERVTVLIVTNEKLLAGKWRFRRMDKREISFSTLDSNVPEFSKLYETDSHGTYHYFKIGSEEIDLRHDDRTLTITFTLEQFIKFSHLLGNFTVDMTPIRKELAETIQRRVELEQIEAFLEQATKKTKKVQGK